MCSQGIVSHRLKPLAVPFLPKSCKKLLILKGCFASPRRLVLHYTAIHSLPRTIRCHHELNRILQSGSFSTEGNFFSLLERFTKYPLCQNKQKQSVLSPSRISSAHLKRLCTKFPSLNKEHLMRATHSSWLHNDSKRQENSKPNLRADTDSLCGLGQTT